jgi:hypothetical protein
MKTKLFLVAIFILLVNLTKAQKKYPIQTIFKGDSVVILTKKQVIEVNRTIDLKNLSLSKYQSSVLKLKDTIKTLRWNIVTTEADLQRKMARVKDSLDLSSSNLMKANSEIEFYKGEMKRIEKLEFIDKRTRRRLTVGIGAALVTWWTIIIWNVIDSK